ncbi:hypothetical protein ZIOFF_022073 [Zingiber officinale]|uniref:Uncharacterized protein n=1 Tax=Zingiber officinale TaxID=94328 RepID=A0A8J5H2B5_ZINOF|nr:hypothetical protein ZIOFF_022073 [Zingiber officinale]
MGCERRLAIDETNLFETLGGIQPFIDLSTNFYNRVFADEEEWGSDLSFRIRRRRTRFGTISFESIIIASHPALIGRHAPFPVTHQAAERWLHHMQQALDSTTSIDPNSKDEMKIAQDEIFGPVQSILKFRQIDLRILNAITLEHPNDIDAAAESILVEILPSIVTSHESSFALQDANEVVHGKGKKPMFYEHQEEERTSNHLSGNELVLWENIVSSHGPTSASANTGSSYSKR